MNPFAKRFTSMSDGSRFFIVAQVDEKTAKRAAESVAVEGEDALVGVIENALNLHAMPRLLGAANSQSSGEEATRVNN